eukprot:8201422-Prorocentrum_lima.AAC.1
MLRSDSGTEDIPPSFGQLHQLQVPQQVWQPQRFLDPSRLAARHDDALRLQHVPILAKLAVHRWPLDDHVDRDVARQCNLAGVVVFLLDIVKHSRS